VLQLPLRVFSIGHRLILLRQRNPLLWQSEEGFNARTSVEQHFWLIEGVYTCAQSYAARTALENGMAGAWARWRNRLAVRAWHWRRQRAKTDWALELANFRNYLAAARICTSFEDRREGFPFMPTMEAAGEERGRLLGGPWDAAIMQFLVRERLCADAAAALEFPLALAQAHYLTWQEREGGLRILNADEMEFKEQCALRDMEAATSAGFATAKEHFEHCMAEAKAAKKRMEDGGSKMAENAPEPVTPHG